MLNQLVESRSNQKENRIGFLLTTFVLVVGLFFSTILYSLFAKDLGIGTDSLQLAMLVAPIQATENTQPEPILKQEKQERKNTAESSLPTRQANIMQIEESLIPPADISVVPNTQKARPAGQFLISDAPETNGIQGSPLGNRIGGNGGGIGVQDVEPSPIENSKPVEPPAPKKPLVEPAQKPKTIIKSSGVINGQAKFLPKPVYSAVAKAVRAVGAVNVQVLIDEAGNVVSANAVDGHSLLKAEAERAARNAKFNPTLLSGQPVKVSGVIVYRFSM